jgi:hypothetical protein
MKAIRKKLLIASVLVSALLLEGTTTANSWIEQAGRMSFVEKLTCFLFIA